MRLGCSSRFRTLSRSESNSRVLWSMAGAGLTPFPARESVPAPLHSLPSPLRGRTESKEERRPLHQAQVQRPRPCPPPSPFRRGAAKKPVKRKRDLFPGSRTASQRSPWRCRQLNAAWTAPAHPAQPAGVRAQSRVAPQPDPLPSKPTPDRQWERHSVHPSGSGILTGVPFGTGVACAFTPKAPDGIPQVGAGMTPTPT